MHAYFWLTEYSFNTLIYQAHMFGYLKLRITKHDFPYSARRFMETTCSSGDCIGAFVPEIGEKYPDSAVEVSVETAVRPVATLTPDRMTINLSTAMEVQVKSVDNNVRTLASTNASITLSFVPEMRQQNLIGKITLHSLSLSNVKFLNGQVLSTPVQMDNALTKLIGLTIIPKLNVLADRGVKLPIAGGVRFVNTYISVKQGYVIVGTDVTKTW
ncbi:bactericidal permeability-increasing protein [Elysia marginata]|uniref:Bactericidal permeability-increasing protein n=1 Tax=Elysia marginata TaxID=1093978 RepID=A0AAV4IBU0_9GAST|nr:bactericidal permeability-increasing protein [Elysia marginata]